MLRNAKHGTNTQHAVRTTRYALTGTLRTVDTHGHTTTVIIPVLARQVEDFETLTGFTILAILLSCQTNAFNRKEFAVIQMIVTGTAIASVLLPVSFLYAGAGLESEEIAVVGADFAGKDFTFQEITGIGKQPGITRRDPSDIIKVGDEYFVYYTYYLYYTGVKPTPGEDVFENNSVNDFTAIGVAVADSPGGPFRRLNDQPILTVSPKSTNPGTPSAFDSYRIDDAALLVRDYDKDGDPDVWLYYKGRNIDHGRSGPAKTQMGLAIADTPAGPYKRINAGKPILPKSHEVMIWPHCSGVAAYASTSRTLEFAPDGIDFTSSPLHVRTASKPIAPGCFRPDLTEPQDFGRGITWGISMVGGPYPYLLRYSINLLAP